MNVPGGGGGASDGFGVLAEDLYSFILLGRSERDGTR